MAFDCFMWLKGGTPPVEGETTDKTYKDKKAFEVYSFSFGASNPVTIGSAYRGVGRRKGQYQQLQHHEEERQGLSQSVYQLLQRVSFRRGSRRIAQSRRGGRRVPEIRFRGGFRREHPVERFLGGDDTPTESVSFAFGKIAMEYTPQSAKGQKGTPIPSNWDLRANLSA